MRWPILRTLLEAHRPAVHMDLDTAVPLLAFGLEGPGVLAEHPARGLILPQAMLALPNLDGSPCFCGMSFTRYFTLATARITSGGTPSRTHKRPSWPNSKSSTRERRRVSSSATT